MGAKELFYKYLEQELEELFGKIKPELKDKFVFGSTRQGDRKWGGITNRLTNPPTISIYINSLEETYRPSLIKAIKTLISHEIIHTFQPKTMPNMEKEAYQKQGEINFFNE